MTTLINHQGQRSITGFSTRAPVLPTDRAYIAAVLKEHEHKYYVIDACGEALDRISKDPLREDLMIQGLTEVVVEQIPPQTGIVGLTCMFSSLWPGVRCPNSCCPPGSSTSACSARARRLFCA
jgi:hypothetical protein